MRFHLVKKKVEKCLQANEKIPGSIAGVITDVIEAVYDPLATTGQNRAITNPRDHQFQMLQPGIGISHIDSDNCGTLGLIVHDKLTGKPAILSNAHVLCKGGYRRERGEYIVQPGRFEWNGGVADDYKIARLHRSILNENCDAAMAFLLPEIGYKYEMYESNARISSVRNPVLGDILKKSGRSTAVTSGLVDGIGRYFQVFKKKRSGINGFRLVPVKAENPENEELSWNGDSGSVWYDPETHEGVGLLFAGDTHPDRVLEDSLACFLPEVMTALDISLFNF